jgi:hypothetical protein
LLDWCEETRDRRIFVREKDPPPVIEGGSPAAGSISQGMITPKYIGGATMSALAVSFN